MSILRWFRRSAREASCAEVARVLQQYLDGEVGTVDERRIRRHLERCRRCGLEAGTYAVIKESLARTGRLSEADEAALERLRRFSARLIESE